MKILVVSDTHGDITRLERILSKDNNFNMIIHLGDYFRDARQIEKNHPEIKVECVYGNCDFMVGDTPADKLIEIEGRRIFATHGHRYSVKNGNDNLIRKARDVKADILLYGHTHISSLEEGNDYCLLNPGSISEPRGSFGESYGIIEILNGKMTCDIRLA